MFTTVRLITFFGDGDDTGSGTAFFFFLRESEGMFRPTLITNKHVLNGATRIRFLMHVEKDGAINSHFPVEVDLAGRRVDHPDAQLDVAMILLSDLFLSLQTESMTPKITPVTDDEIETDGQLLALGAVNNVVMPGYPIGISDEVNNYPIFRQGTTALHPATDYEGLPKGMLDISCHPGTSGSPVFALNEHHQKGYVLGSQRMLFLGVVYASIYDWETDVEICEIPTSRKKRGTPHKELAVRYPVPTRLTLYVKAKALLIFRDVLV